jgi:hypothetical protein
VSYVDQYWDSDDRQQMLGDVEVTVMDSFWSTPRIESKGKAQFDGADKVQLYWHARVDEIFQEYDKVPPEVLNLQMSIGDGWLTDEHGTLVENKDDPPEEKLKAGKAKPIQFKGSSFYGKFLGLCGGKYDSYYTQTVVDPMTAPPTVLDDGDKVEYDLAEVRALLARRHANPRNASIWVGFRWRCRGLGFYYSRPPQLSGMKVCPVAFLGIDEAVASAHTPGQTSLSGAAPADQVVVHPELVSATLPGASAALVEDLTKLIGTSGSHVEFMRNALNIDEVKGDDGLKAAVMDAKEGPWAQRGKELEDTESEQPETNPGLAAEQAADEAS